MLSTKYESKIAIHNMNFLAIIIFQETGTP